MGSGRKSKERGKRGEREVAKMTEEITGLPCRRGVQYKGSPDSPDVVGLPGYHIEVKFVERLNLRQSIEQSEHDAGEDEIPVVVHRRTFDKWRITMPYEDFCKLYAEAYCK